MGFALAPTAIDQGFRLEAHDSVGSTNQIAMERAAAGDEGPLWIVSKRQLAGRGRRGREWATPEGNLASTLLLGGLRDLRSAATLGFVAGLALADALDAVAPQARFEVGIDGAESGARNRFELKWPNDVLVGGAKLAGILLESTVLGNGGNVVAVGIGVNVVSFPADTPYPATSLAALSASCDAETLFVALSDAWTTHHRVWNGGFGIDAIRRRWLERAAGLGGEVAVRVDGAVVRGIFETIDEECRFVIRDDDGRRTKLAAGDVHFGAIASAAAI